MPKIPGLTGMFSGSGGAFMSSLGEWMLILLITAFIAGGFIIIYLWMQYKYKVIIFEKGGVGLPNENNTYSVGRIKKDRMRLVKDKAKQVIAFKLLFSNKKIKPLDMKNIMPNNYAFLFRTTPDTFVPVDFTCGNPVANLSVIDMDVKKWQQLEITQAYQDYQKHDFWTDNKQFIMTLLTVGFCCALAGFVIWISFQKADTIVPALERLAGAFRDANVIPSAPM